MNVVALIEMHPFDGSEPFTCLRLEKNGHLFDLPITPEQLSIVVANTKHADNVPGSTSTEAQNYDEDSVDEPVESETYAYETSPINQPPSDFGSNRSEYSMGTMFEDDDDEL